MLEFTPVIPTSKLAICSVERLFAQIWPRTTGFLQPQHVLTGAHSALSCESKPCRGFAAPGNHGGSQKCHRNPRARLEVPIGSQRHEPKSECTDPGHSRTIRARV